MSYKYFRFWGGNYRCIVCSTSIRSYFPLSNELQRNAVLFGFPYDFKRMETLNYAQCNCPFCMSSDRERLYMMYLKKYLNPLAKRYSVLDFAPTPAFAKKMKTMGYDYQTADLFREDVDIKVDICDMSKIYDESYDFVICSHILEHVNNPDLALSEIYRILRKFGQAIVMVPLFMDVHQTLEDSSHNTNPLRWKYYGQGDHVRLFCRRDFLDRLEMAGFTVEQKGPPDFEIREIFRNAIAKDSILYVCSRRT